MTFSGRRPFLIIYFMSGAILVEIAVFCESGNEWFGFCKRWGVSEVTNS